MRERVRQRVKEGEYVRKYLRVRKCARMMTREGVALLCVCGKYPRDCVQRFEG